MDAKADLPEPRERRAALALVAALSGLAPTGTAVRAEQRAEIQRPEATSESERLIETLSARLLTAHSATAVLEAWCAERGLATDPRLSAVRVEGPVKPLSREQRERLAVGPDEPIRYRRVRLTCGAHVLSEADNWYVPGRLTPEMNAILDTTQTPFGRVVHRLEPVRRNLSVTRLWTPGESGPPGAEARLFSVQAVLSTRGVPFCEVAETYTGAVLARGE